MPGARRFASPGRAEIKPSGRTRHSIWAAPCPGRTAAAGCRRRWSYRPCGRSRCRA